MNYAGCLRKMDVPAFVSKYPPAAQNATEAGGTPAKPKQSKAKPKSNSTKGKSPGKKGSKRKEPPSQNM